MQEIVITISPSGSTKIEANGFTGDACDKATQSIEIALSGGKEVDKSHKPEFHQPESTSCEVKRTF